MVQYGRQDDNSPASTNMSRMVKTNGYDSGAHAQKTTPSKLNRNLETVPMSVHVLGIIRNHSVCKRVFIFFKKKSQLKLKKSVE